MSDDDQDDEFVDIGRGIFVSMPMLLSHTGDLARLLRCLPTWKELTWRDHQPDPQLVWRDRVARLTDDDRLTGIEMQRVVHEIGEQTRTNTRDPRAVQLGVEQLLEQAMAIAGRTIAPKGSDNA